MSIQSPSDLQWWRLGAAQAIIDALFRRREENKLSPKEYNDKQQVVSRAQANGEDDTLKDYLNEYVPGDAHVSNYPS